MPTPSCFRVERGPTVDFMSIHRKPLPNKTALFPASRAALGRPVARCGIVAGGVRSKTDHVSVGAAGPLSWPGRCRNSKSSPGLFVYDPTVNRSLKTSLAAWLVAERGALHCRASGRTISVRLRGPTPAQRFCGFSHGGRRTGKVIKNIGQVVHSSRHRSLDGWQRQWRSCVFIFLLFR